MSLSFVALALPVVYALGRRLFGARSATAGITILAVNAITIQIAQLALPLAFVLLLSSVLSLAFVAAIDRGSPQAVAGYAVVAGLGLFAAPSAAVVTLMAHAAAVVLLRRASYRSIVAGTIVAALGAATAAFVATATGYQVLDLSGGACGVILPDGPGRSAGIIRGANLLVLLGLAAAGSLAVLKLPRTGSAGERTTMIALPLLGIPLAMAAATAFVAPSSSCLAFVVALPGLALLVGFAIIALHSRPAQTMTVLAVLLIGAAGLYRWYGAPFDDWRGAAAYIGKLGTPSDAAIVFPPENDAALRPHLGAGPELRDAPPTAELAAALADSVASVDGRLWILLGSDASSNDLASLKLLEGGLRKNFQKQPVEGIGRTSVILWQPVGWNARHQCWLGDYEPGHDWTALQGVPGSFRRIMDPVHQGTFAGSFTLHPGDLASGGERAEMVRDIRWHAGGEMWQRWSIYLPSDSFWVEPGGEVIVTQWHDNEPSGGTPPVLVTIQNRDGANYVGLAVRGGDQQSAKGISWLVGEAPANRWIDLQLHVKWSASPDGLVEFWLDGTQMLSEKVPTIFTGKGVYLKQGIYRSPAAEVSTLYQDATVVAPTEAGLACP